MAKSLKKIVYSIKEELTGYNITDDVVFSNEYLIDKINDVREVIIKEHFKESGIDGQFYQTICCLEVKCFEHGCTLNGKFYKSGSIYWYVELPALIESVGWKNIMYFGLDDFKTQFARNSFDAYLSNEGALWTSKMPIYTVVDGKAILKNLPTPGLRYICIMALLQNPQDACNWDEESPYPVPDVHKLELLVKKDIMSLYGVIPDEKHDARDMKGVPTQSQNQFKNRDEE